MSSLGNPKSTWPPSRAGSAAPSTQSTPSNTSGPDTRKNKPTNLLTREGAIDKAPGGVKTLEKAMAYLSSKGYVPDAAPLNLVTISFILFQLAATTHSATDSNGIKAIAFLLEEINVDKLAETLADRIGATLDEKIRAFGQSTQEVRAQDVRDFQETVKEQRNELEEVRRGIKEAAAVMAKGKEDLEGTQASLENAVGEIAEVLSSSLRDISEQVNVIISPDTYANFSPPSHPPAPPALVAQPQPTDAFSYAAVTRTHLPSTHATNITRNNDKRRQFTILPASSDSDMGLANLSEMEIVAKLSLAYDTMVVRKDMAPSEVRFSGVRRMRKGGIMFELNSDAAADWLRNEEVQADFTTHFSATAKVHSYQFRVMAEFVPVSFDAGASYATQTIEEANYLPTGSIAEVEWVKKIERRSATQHVAHLRISFTSIEQANYAIEKGLSIQGKGVNVRQMLVEPQRCAKCQLYGHNNNRGAPHFARECTWTHDVCGLCGDMHRTSACGAKMPEQAQCANCKTSGRGDFKGHTVHSRSCPTFIEKKNQYDHKHGSQQYRFFVTEDTRTWETSQPMAITSAPSQDFSLGSQPYPTPPPNQLQRPDYPRPENDSRTNDRWVPAPGRGRRPTNSAAARPRGMQVSASNRLPLGTRQGKLTRYFAIADVLDEDDETDREIAETGLTGRIRPPVQETGANTGWGAVTEGVVSNSWAENTSTALPEVLSTTTSSQPRTPRQSSSPIRFPSTEPSTPAASVSV